MKTIVPSIALLLALTGNAAQPIVPEALGYEMGQTIEGGEERTVDTPPASIFQKRLDNPPEPFSYMALYHTEKAGLCAIKATIARHHDLYSRFVETLTERYGEPNADFRLAETKERIAWREPTNSSGIYSVVLRRQETWRSRWRVSLYYTFYNYDQCRLADPFRSIEDQPY